MNDDDRWWVNMTDQELIRRLTVDFEIDSLEFNLAVRLERALKYDEYGNLRNHD